MKKVLSLILAAVLAMSVMTGCSASDSKEETKTDEFTLTMQIGNPVMTVNGEVYGRLTPDMVPAIIKKYKDLEAAN